MLETFLILYAISTIWAIFNILLYGNRPARSIGWILIVIALPLAGVVIYIVFGINRKKFKFYKLNFNAKRRLYDFKNIAHDLPRDDSPFIDEKYHDLNDLLKKSSDFPALKGNKVTLLKTGEEAFESIYEALRSAKSFIHAQYYIIEDGEAFGNMCEIFSEKIKEGVEIRILYDAFGSYDLHKKKIKTLQKMGIKIFPILPLKFNTILSTLNYRNHRKILVVDGLTAFTGGVNVSDKYLDDDNPMGKWSDMHVKLEGFIVDHLHRVFIKDYYYASDEELLTKNEKYIPTQKKAGDSLVQIIAGGPDHEHLSILHQYMAMINAATESIYIENPYFIPNVGLLEAIKIAALKGVKVKIMVPEKNDSKLARYSMFSNFQSLLKIGIEIHTLEEGFSHRKLIIIDKEIASIGSGNFDYRSFEYNYEANTLIYDKEIAAELAADFEKENDNCCELIYEDFKERPLKTKLLEGASKIFSPLL